jgi:hypothetical protein
MLYQLSYRLLQKNGRMGRRRFREHARLSRLPP